MDENRISIAERLHVSNLNMALVVLMAGPVPLGTAAQIAKFGVSACLAETESIGTLAKAIKSADAGGIYISHQIAQQLSYDPHRKRFDLPHDGPLSDLTPRQLQVLRMLAEG